MEERVINVLSRKVSQLFCNKSLEGMARGNKLWAILVQAACVRPPELVGGGDREGKWGITQINFDYKNIKFAQ